MKNLVELLLEKSPEAVGYPAGLACHDLWLVGGAARHLLSGERTMFPNDIDLLVNTEKLPMIASAVFDKGSGGQGQKQTIGGIQFDVFENGLTRWLEGAPCYGDQLAVRVTDNFVLCSPEALFMPSADRNPRWSGDRVDYFERHANSLRRDDAAFAFIIDNFRHQS